MEIENQPVISGISKAGSQSKIMLLFLILQVLLGSMYIYYTWIAANRDASEQALNLAWTAKASLQDIAISKLKALPQDAQKPQYQHINASLIKLLKVNPNIRNAYLYTRKNGRLYFLVDSELPG